MRPVSSLPRPPFVQAAPVGPAEALGQRPAGERPADIDHVHLVAAGRRSNADLLRPEQTGVETDEHGWIVVDDYLQTTQEGIKSFQETAEAAVETA